MALPGIGNLWQLARRIDGIFVAVENATRGLARLRDDVQALEQRVARLEAGQELLVEKAKGAAAVAASGAVTQHLVDMSRRIGALEAGQGAAKRLE